MILKEYNLSVRLPQEKAIDTGITLVQNDKDVYKLNVRIFDGVNEIDYSEVDSATITFLKRDNNVVQGNMTVEADQLSYTLGTNEIACPGKVLVGIQLWGSTERLSTARFVMRVEKDLITEDAVQSTSEFSVLQQLKQDLEAIDVVDLTNQFNAHKVENVTDSGGVHGLVYEEGTWTPTLSFAGINGETTYSTQVGTYVKINSIVSLFFYLVINVKDESLAGCPEIRGVPFSNKVTGMLYGVNPVRLSNCNFNKDQLRLTFPSSSSANNYLRFYKNTTQTSVYVESDIQNGFTITGYISYEI